MTDAQKVRVAFDLDEYELGSFSPPEDPDHDAGLFAIVAAVSDSDGRQSPFTVVYSSHLCEVIDDLECPKAYWSQLGSYPVR